VSTGPGARLGGKPTPCRPPPRPTRWALRPGPPPLTPAPLPWDALAQARRIGDLEAERARLLAALPPRQRELIVTRQADAAEGQGSDKWIFPAPILREAAFRERERLAEAEAAGGGG
jgi:hypothetical protein